MKLKSLIPFALIVGTLFLASTPASSQPFGEDRRYFKDWLAACRPTTQYCSATAYINPNSGNGTVADFILRVGRHIDRKAEWEISFTVISTILDASRPLSVQVFGNKSNNFFPSDTYSAYGSLNDFFLTGGNAQRLLNDMIDGDQIRFSFLDFRAQPFDATFSLSGLSAALLWMDDSQQKLGSKRIAGAEPLRKKKVAPQSKQQAILTGGFPTRLIEKHEAEQADCDLVSNGDINPELGEIAALSESNTLFIIPCFIAAYNAGFRVYVGDSGEIGGFRTQLFATYNANGTWSATDIPLGVRFDANTQVLSTYVKSRGLGDCGNAGRYHWNGWQFELIEYRQKPNCDEISGAFPLVFSAPNQ